MKTHASPSLTLAHAFEQFLDGSSFARRTRESYAEDLVPLFTEVGQQPVTALTVDVLQKFLAHQESLAAATYNRRLAALRSFTRWLREQGWVADTLLDGMKRKPEGKRSPRALDARQVESVLRKIENPRDRALFWLIYDGGLRCQEALAIDIDDISWSERSIRIHGKVTAPARCSSRVLWEPSWTSTWRHAETRRRDRSSSRIGRPVYLGVQISLPTAMHASRTGRSTHSGKAIPPTGISTSFVTKRSAFALP
jgi:site-specific recombinase XerC